MLVGVFSRQQGFVIFSVIHDNIQEYVKPISLEYLSIVAYGCFLFLVYIMKVRSLCDVSAQKKGVN